MRTIDVMPEVVLSSTVALQGEIMGLKRLRRTHQLLLTVGRIHRNAKSGDDETIRVGDLTVSDDTRVRVGQLVGLLRSKGGKRWEVDIDKFGRDRSFETFGVDG